MRVLKLFIVVVMALFFFPDLFSVYLPEANGAAVQANEAPRWLLRKNEAKVIIRKGAGSRLTLVSSKSTREEILQKLVDESTLTLNFYCEDPGLSQDRAANVTVSGDSIFDVLRQLLGGDYRLSLLNKEGKPEVDMKLAAGVNVYAKNCTRTEHPVRVFIAGKKHPVLMRSSKEISIEELGDVLRREGPASRRWAADILGIKTDEKGIALAKEALKDENPRVMLAALQALRRLGRKFGNEKVKEAIYDRYKERPYPEFLPVMVEVEKERIWPVIEALIGQPDAKQQSEIIRALVLTKDQRAIKYLSKIAFTGNPENARQAMNAMGTMGGPEAAAILVKILEEGDGPRQAGAAQAVYFLPKSDSSQARRAVENILTTGKFSDEFLQGLAEVGYLEPLENLIKGPGQAELKVRALQAIAKKGTEKSIKVIRIGVNDEAPQVRLASVEAIGGIKIEEAVPVLIKATGDKEARVRIAAVKGLSDFPGDEQVAEVVGKTVNDSDDKVRKQAIDTLYLLGKPTDKMIAILKECEKHKDPYVAKKAASTLEYWGLKK